MTLAPQGDRTVLTWDVHFEAENVEANRSALAEALNQDIARRLLDRFGGRALESFVEGRGST